MTNSDPLFWANSGLDLYVELRDARPRSVRVRLEDGLRQAIRSGRLTRGTRLPPTRALASDLGISRGTVLAAYSQLIAEGWLSGRTGSGTVVALDADTASTSAETRAPRPPTKPFDLQPGRPDASSFPRTEWLKALRRALSVAPHDVFGYSDVQGLFVLREELAGYLRRSRGLRVTPTDILVTAGFTQTLGLLARALAASGVHRVAVEEPSMPLHRSILRAAGHELVMLRVDDDGAPIEHVETVGGVGAVVLTPNRQHPTGALLSATRRARLLSWAGAEGAIVIEDDYDGEFRYDSRPIGPLQGLDPAVVAYAGTASKTLAPGVRLGWLTLPPALRDAVIAEKQHADWQSGTLDQLAFAELLRTTAYDRHVRRMRLHYRRRRDTLLQKFATEHPRLTITGTDAGLNVVLPLPDASTEAAARAASDAAGIALDGLVSGGYYETHGPAGLLVGYAAPASHVFPRALDTLANALHGIAD